MPTDPTPTEPITNQYSHNFTTDGKASEFFTIEGNLSSSKGTVEYSGLTLTQSLKMESATSITFTTVEDTALTLVFNTNDDAEVKIDGTTHQMTDGVVTVSLNPGTHVITKDDVANLYFMNLS